MNIVSTPDPQAPPGGGDILDASTGDLFRLVMEHAAIGMALVSPDGRFLAVNPALCTMLARPADELLTMTWQELTHPADVAADLGHLQEMLSGRVDSYRLRKRYVRADDVVVWGDLSVSCLRADDGSVRHLSAQIVDVTAEVEANKALQETADGFRRIADAANAAIVTADVNGAINGWNRAAERMFGRVREEALGYPVAMLVPERDAAWLTAATHRVGSQDQASGDAEAVERIARRRDGSEFPAEFALCAWTLAGERRLTVIIRDATAQHAAAAALRHSERRLRSILDTTPDLIAIYDLESRQVTAVNRGVERALGRSREALAQTGADLSALLLPPEHEQVFQSTVTRLQTLRPGEVLEWDSEAHSIQGEPIWLWVRATVFDTRLDGGAASILLTAMDITAEHRAEAALAATAERLQTVMNTMLDAHLVHRALRDGDGAIVDFEIVNANPAACALHGLACEDLVGSRLGALYPQFVSGEALRLLARVVETGEPLIMDGATSVLESPDGRPRRVDVRAVRLGDGISETVRDVTARYEAEEALHRRFVEINALQRISRLLAQRIDLGSALDSVCDLLVTLFEACTVRVRVLGDEGCGACEHVAGDRDRCREDVAAEAEAIAAALTSRRATVATMEQGAELLVVPLRAHDDTVGALSIVRNPQRGVLSVGEQALASTAADLLAAVVRSERLSAVETEQASVAERQRLARNLHDAVTQSIFSANLMAEVLPSVWEQQPEEAFRDMLVIRRLIRAAFAELRVLLFELRPESLAMAPLETLLERLSDALAGQADVDVEVAVEDEVALPDEVRMAFYRITQEALSNVAKHAGASRVVVNIDREGDAVRLVVQDDGHGFAPDELPGGMGQRLMRERADSIGADLEVQSTPESGTTVTLVWRESGSGADGRT